METDSFFQQVLNFAEPSTSISCPNAAEFSDRINTLCFAFNQQVTIWGNKVTATFVDLKSSDSAAQAGDFYYEDATSNKIPNLECRYIKYKYDSSHTNHVDGKTLITDTSTTHPRHILWALDRENKHVIFTYSLLNIHDTQKNFGFYNCDDGLIYSKKVIKSLYCVPPLPQVSYKLDEATNTKPYYTPKSIPLLTRSPLFASFLAFDVAKIYAILRRLPLIDEVIQQREILAEKLSAINNINDMIKASV